MSEAPAAVMAVVAAAARHPAVTGLQPVGSRVEGEPTALSDWDFAVEAEDHDAVVATLPTAIEATAPLALLWDPLSPRWDLMVVVDGPSKVDLILDAPHEPAPPWLVDEGTRPMIDQHFWDWALWLGSKHLRGRRVLVDDELAKLFDHILGPLGAGERPVTVDEAVAAYQRLAAPSELGRQVAGALAAAGVIRPR